MQRMFSGGCACGAVRYEAGASVLMMNCHCRDCQRASGSGYAPFVVVPKASFEFSGELQFYESAGGNRQKGQARILSRLRQPDRHRGRDSAGHRGPACRQP